MRAHTFSVCILSVASAVFCARGQDFNGSVPQQQTPGPPVALSFQQAIQDGLHTNLGLLTTQETSEELRAARLRALSALLPTLTGQAGEVVQQLNLQALGFNLQIPGFNIPHIVGPYSYQEALVNGNVPLFNYSSLSNLRASRENSKAAALSVKNARDLVVEAVANAYLRIVADAARVDAVEAEVTADNAVYTNAVRRHDAGLAIGIDVLRSQVQLKQRQQALVVARNQFAIDKLGLGRVIGLAPGQDFTIADPSNPVPLEAMTVESALAKAYDNRADYQAAKAQVLAARFTARGARAERYPTLGAQGFWGDEGLHLFSNSHGVFQVNASVQFNIFDGGRIRSDVQQANAELKNRENELANLRGQIDYDVRSALLNVKAAADQVDVAKSNLDLAGSTLQEARDRFTAGVTNTVEVVQAQQAVADANEALISAQFQYNIAKVSLARALGLAEQGIQNYFAATK